MDLKEDLSDSGIIAPLASGQLTNIVSTAMFKHLQI